jgi:hypothetical protein
MNQSTRKILIAVALGLALFLSLPFLLQQERSTATTPPVQENAALPAFAQPVSPAGPLPVQAARPFSSGVIENAYRNNATSLPVMESGTVSRILPDDNQGSRHQRFIVSLASGHTVLIAHNIDIAPRINNLREGDQIVFSGKYEWNDKGGVVHWTHHDPSGRYGGGYLQHNGMTYQ